MTTTELNKEYYTIWSINSKKWIKQGDLEIEIKYGILFGDPGGDTFLKEFATEGEFNKGLQDHFIEGITGCDFATIVYIIIKDGKEYKPIIS